MNDDRSSGRSRAEPYGGRWAVTAATLVLFALVLGALALHGAAGRVILGSRTTLTVSAPEDAFRAWKVSGVRGRVLLLFDRYPHFQTLYRDHRTGTPLTAANFLDFAVFENVVRKIYLVLGDEEWAAFKRDPRPYRPFRKVRGIPEAFYLQHPGGLPFIAAPPSSLPDLSEEVLVYVNRALFDPEQVSGLLARRGIRSDLVVVFQEDTSP